MVNDLVALFKSAYEKNGDKMILDIYTPKEGLYIKVSIDGQLEYLCIDKDTSKDNDLYKWFRNRDYYCNLVSMNKPVDPNKKIHSNNCFSIFIKKDMFPGLIEDNASKSKSKAKNKERLTDKEFNSRTESYYSVLSSNREDADKKTAELQKTISKVSDKDMYFLKEYVTKRLADIIDLANKEKFKGYIKLFLDKEICDYQNESNKYLVPKIFNKNDFNVSIDEEIFGLSNDNMSLNSKKPFLEHRTTEYKVPFRVTIENALVSKKFFDWLSFQENTTIYIPLNKPYESDSTRENANGACYYIHFNKGISSEITDFDFLSNYDNKINFPIENFLGEEGLYSEIITSLEALESHIDMNFFFGKLKYSYYQDDSSMIIRDVIYEKELRNLITIYAMSLHSYFWKGQVTPFKSVIDKLSSSVIDILFRNYGNMSTIKIKNAINLRFSILKNLQIGGYEMADRILPIRELLIKKVNSEEIQVIESDEEFYFASGQIAYYLISQSQAANKTYSMLEPFFRAKTGVELKKQINYIFEYYKHAVNINASRFRNMLGMVEGYISEKGMKENKDIFLAGFMSQNIMYLKGEK